MSRVKTLALAVVVLFALAGCAQLFEFNLFGSLDNPPTPTAADYQGSAGLDQLAEDLKSPARIDALIESGIVDDIQLDLWNTYLLDGSVDNTEDAQAAILYADLALKTTEGENLVNNIADMVSAILSGSIDSNTDVQTILANIVPPEALASETTFTAMVNALLMANDAYILLGESINQGAPDEDLWDPATALPPGSLPGDVAQKAVVAHCMWASVEAVKLGPPGMTESAPISEMFLIANGKASSIKLGTFAILPDPIFALLNYAGLYPPPP
jgi:hypothetical protein